MELMHFVALFPQPNKAPIDKTLTVRIQIESKL